MEGISINLSLPIMFVNFFFDLLPFYAILRSIPSKIIGVIAMFTAILALLALPFVDLGRSRGLQFRPISKIFFWVFASNFLVLMIIGAKHVEDPYIIVGQLSTGLYFAWFFLIMPVVSVLENTLFDISNSKDIGRN